MARAFRKAVAGGRVLALPAKPINTLQVPAIKERTGNSGKEVGRMCVVCGTVNRPGAKFCRKDGVKLSSLSPMAGVKKADEYILICPACGFVNRAGAKYCVKDGTLLYKKLS
jgi:ribosomal protein L40E